MSSANKGSASALSRWCSHTRLITYSNNPLAVLGVHHLIAFGAVIERTRQDLSQSIAKDSNTSTRFVLNIVYFLLVCSYFSVLGVVLVLNEEWKIVEQTI